MAMAAPLDPMVPVNPDMADAKTLAADLRAARERWGLRRFVLTGPHAVIYFAYYIISKA